ncbi:DUF885 domain-containing protein [Shewanella sp. JNE10-2]|uniref:DUF885 domain-containing protein n=1 Tax=unclassified Shewanella TaxID=196818 RepID=UPI0020056D7E|nr:MULTISPECIES: DUF885 domain-containing protein [unclassified Shewanella]MCK7629617.1 DUF885 domain-containing protein [Shewanella sp. JNE9-1]MCK7632925.1 DUF885 domain-containing protein [Shewanella sp. JNE17]MCK7644787.1 DUF885 domain-containing protein [Shewanella sp. JNE3-1]MCK7647573.1 DUF885 domain-containing protein [Shewanella sp. JNE8]MCK7652920.1 DUF885 domain-containing protein [Shewanella sp. JNE4-1]
MPITTTTNTERSQKLNLKISLVTLALSAAMALSVQAAPAAMVHLNASEPTQSTTQTESEKANALFEAIFMENIMASPIAQTYMGIKQDYDKWDDIGDEADAIKLLRTKKQLAEVNQLDATKLDPQTQLSLKLLKQNLQNDIDDYQWSYHNYPVNQMRGGHSMIASFLINQHQINNISDAQAYISRLNGVPKRLNQLQKALEIRAEKNIIAPKFVFSYVISDSQNIIKGAPFDKGDDSALLADFSKKVNALDIQEKEKKTLITGAEKALVDKVKPAYNQLIHYIETLAAQADTRDGVWKLPNGAAFYNNALARTTTTHMTADQIHELGIAEVTRIHNEMRTIMQKVHYKGSLQEFFGFMRDAPQFYYPNTAEGKAAYLTEATKLIDNIQSRLDEVFKVKPKAAMIVKQVEAFREKSAGKAFYEQPAPDGSRPGSYYANLYDMKAMPKYQMEALAYHEGIPGHHMQIAIAQELKDIPKFRKFGGYTAYIEGWGLYSESFPKEMGLYADPYSDFGRLAMELWRACRLVVDTGIHAKQWTREQGIAYYVDNTPNAKSDAVKMVERHIVMPSQATAYKVGMIKLLELKHKAEKQLGDKFDIRDFHTLVLANGALPLDVLEEQVDQWIASVNKA